MFLPVGFLPRDFRLPGCVGAAGNIDRFGSADTSTWCGLGSVKTQVLVIQVSEPVKHYWHKGIRGTWFETRMQLCMSHNMFFS